MGWLSVVATGLVIRGSRRRRQRHHQVMRDAREMDRQAQLDREELREFTIWPPEAPDED
jgi:uncharacterized membrane protein